MVDRINYRINYNRKLDHDEQTRILVQIRPIIEKLILDREMEKTP